jgi:hypothetical protein
MKRKIWLYVIVIIVAIFGIFSMIRIANYEPTITYVPLIKAADVDEVTIAALALYSSQ